MSKQSVKQNAFQFSWQNVPAKSTETTDGYRTMRFWQTKAFDQLKHATHMILNAPMGSGKSWMMCMLSAFKMKNNGLLKSVISVPQTIIAPGFIEAKLQMPNGEKIHWRIKHNLCNEQSKKGTVNSFISWLENNSTDFNERVLVCTHATLVAVYRKLKAEGRLNLFSNILLWVDEAHHVKNVSVEDMDGAVISNGLGELVGYLLKTSNENVQLGLTTASYFRGDRGSLLTDEMENKFVRFNLAYDEYLKSMSYLKSFSFDFLVCGSDYVNAIGLLVSQRVGKDIIYVPHPKSLHSTGDKYQEVSKIIDKYSAIHGTHAGDTDNGLKILRESDKEFKILDLVNEERRSHKKDFLNSDHLKKQSSALDAIIALGMFKEGANWIFADRSIIVGARSSLVDVIQMVGRLFRDAKGKEHVEVIQLLPFSLDQQDEEAFRENLNNYLKAIYASLILENILNPIKIKSLAEKQKKDSEGEAALVKDWLSVELPDEGQRLNLLDEVSSQLMNVMDKNNQASTDVPILWEEYQKIIPTILTEHGVISNQENVARQIWGMLARKTLRMEGIAVEDIDFDILQKTNPLGFLLKYTSGICDINTFQRLRDAIEASRISPRPFEDARNLAHNLKLRNWEEWVAWAKSGDRPRDIPSAPNRAYAGNGWIDWGNFLGTNTVASQKVKYFSFEEAKKNIQALGITTETEWREWKRNNQLPFGISGKPERTYAKKGWSGWGDFLDTGNVANQNKDFVSYAKAKNYARTLNLRGKDEWAKWTKTKQRPDWLPTNPRAHYKNNGWIGWGDFLGTGNIANQDKDFLLFEEARVYARSKGFTRKVDWEQWARTADRPKDIPALPSKYYATCGWINWPDWLGY